MTRLLSGLGWTFAALFWATLILGNVVLLEGTALAQQGGNPCTNTTPNTNGWCKCNCIHNWNEVGGCRYVFGRNAQGVISINQNVVNCCNTACDAAYPVAPPGGGGGGGGTQQCQTDGTGLGCVNEGADCQGTNYIGKCRPKNDGTGCGCNYQ